MSLGQELIEQVQQFFGDDWTKRAGRVVPEAEDLTLANEAIEFDAATVLYTDLSGSTELVNTREWWFAAEVYKSFLYCAARVIAAEDGSVTAYDGDRVMAVFIGQMSFFRGMGPGLFRSIPPWGPHRVTCLS